MATQPHPRRGEFPPRPRTLPGVGGRAQYGAHMAAIAVCGGKHGRFQPPVHPGRQRWFARPPGLLAHSSHASAQVCRALMPPALSCRTLRFSDPPHLWSERGRWTSGSLLTVAGSRRLAPGPAVQPGRTGVLFHPRAQDRRYISINLCFPPSKSGEARGSSA